MNSLYTKCNHFAIYRKTNVEPGLGDGQVKQHGIVWSSRSKGLIQYDCGFVLLLIDKFATDLVLNRDVADVGRARHSRDGQINALGRELADVFYI